VADIDTDPPEPPELPELEPEPDGVVDELLLQPARNSAAHAAIAVRDAGVKSHLYVVGTCVTTEHRVLED